MVAFTTSHSAVLTETTSASAYNRVSLAAATDEELLLAYRERNDREAFETLVYRYESPLLGYLRHQLGDRAPLEDIFQETFLKIHQRCHTFDASQAFRPWLYQIAKNTVRDWFRYTNRRPAISLDTVRQNTDNSSSYASEHEGREGDPSDRLSLDDDVRTALAAMVQLTDVQRETLRLIYFQGMTYREAAEATGTNSETLKSRLSTAIKRLNAILSAPFADAISKTA